MIAIKLAENVQLMHNTLSLWVFAYINNIL